MEASITLRSSHRNAIMRNLVKMLPAVPLLYSIAGISGSLLQTRVTVTRFWSLNLFKREKLLFHPFLQAYNIIGKVSGIIRQLVDTNPRRNRAAFVLSSRQNLGNLAIGNAIAGMCVLIQTSDMLGLQDLKSLTCFHIYSTPLCAACSSNCSTLNYLKFSWYKRNTFHSLLMHHYLGEKRESFALVVHFSVQVVSPNLVLSVHGHIIQAL